MIVVVAAVQGFNYFSKRVPVLLEFLLAHVIVVILRNILADSWLVTSGPLACGDEGRKHMQALMENEPIVPLFLEGTTSKL